MSKRPTTIRGVLIAAHALLSARGGWIAGDWAQTRDGQSVPPRDPVACRFCPVGAVEAVTTNSRLITGAIQRLDEAAHKFTGDVHGIMFLNDEHQYGYPRTRRRYAFKCFDLAIANSP